MATKIKKIIDTSPPGGVFLSSWLSAQGITRSEQINYVKTGWLKKIAHGVYCLASTECRLFPSLYSLSKQSGFKYHLGAFTALDLKGFTHFGQIGKPNAFIYSSKEVPSWIPQYNWEMNLYIVKTDRYGDIGLTHYEVDGNDIMISTPERAFFECLDLIPQKANPLDLFYIMEMLTTLRSTLLNSLLLKASIKTKRLFLYMAEKAKHPWLDEIETSNLELGSGDRSLSIGGVYDRKYKIVIPKELANYE